MRKADIDLILNLRNIFDLYLNDQNQETQRYKVKDIPNEIHGQLADMLYVDKVDNDALVNFIAMLVSSSRNHDDSQILMLLKDIRNTLSNYNFEADDTGKAH